MTACARSPLTGAVGDSQCGGFFPAEMRNAGADAIVFTGVAKEPVYLSINDGKAELRPAKHLWGKVTADVDRLLKEELGDQKCEIAQIGPIIKTAVAVGLLCHFFADGSHRWLRERFVALPAWAQR